MNAEKLSEAINEINDRYYEEAAGYHCQKHRWVKWGGIAACLALLSFAVLSVLPGRLGRQDGVPAGTHTAAVLENPEEDTSPGTSDAHIRMDRIFFNEIGPSADVARVWRDPELYKSIEWDKIAVTDYYGRDLTPIYVPEDLTAAAGNGTASVIADKHGRIVEDTARLGFYHDYYADGSPRLTENTAAKKGFSITVSRIGLLPDCIYILPENEVTDSNINGTAVTFGYRSMPYGPYDPDTHKPSGYYDIYVAEFEYDGIEYRIIAEQLEAAEVVKIVSSVIYGEEVTVDD